MVKRKRVVAQLGTKKSVPGMVASGNPFTLAVVLIVFEEVFTAVTCGKMLLAVPVPAVPLPFAGFGAWKQIAPVGQGGTPFRIVEMRNVPSKPLPVPVTFTATPGVRSCPPVNEYA